MVDVPACSTGRDRDATSQQSKVIYVLSMCSHLKCDMLLWRRESQMICGRGSMWGLDHGEQAVPAKKMLAVCEKHVLCLKSEDLHLPLVATLKF